jgi:precorrin-6A/cobalt-precorrin-6A reductase
VAILMHKPLNRQAHVWLLAGTGEGPVIAAALLQQGVRVSVSVVTESAGRVYGSLPLANLWVGPLAGAEAIGSRVQQAGVDQLVDATHPFATQITAQLQLASQRSGCPLLRFERPLEPAPGSCLVDAVTEIPAEALRGQRLLLAVGARFLSQLVPPLRTAGAELYARVLPTPKSLRQAVAAGLPDAQLALIHPSQTVQAGVLERALCRHWQIDAVLCRQSGGVTERCWHQVADQLSLPLWLLCRPEPPSSLELVHSLEELLARIGP